MFWNFIFKFSLILFIMTLKCSDNNLNSKRSGECVYNGSLEQIRYFKVARQMLLTNMKNFHNNVKPTNLRVSGFFNFYGQAATFLDSNDVISLLSVDKKTNIAAREQIRLKLYRFSPHFVFEEDWFNAVVYKILDDNGLSSIRLNDPRTIDLVTLMAFKYAFRDHVKLKIPQYIHLGIISFAFEMVYGSNVQLPIDNPSQMIHFLGEMLLETDSSLPETLAYFSGVLSLPLSQQQKRFSNTCQPNHIRSKNAIRLLEFLVTKPDLPTHRQFHNTNNARITTYNRVEILLLKQREPEVQFDCMYLSFLGSWVRPCTSTLLTRIHSAADRENLKVIINNSWYGPMLRKELGYKAQSDVIEHIWSRDYKNPFEFGELEVLNEVDSYDLLEASIPYILKLYIAEKISTLLPDSILSKRLPFEIYEMLIVEGLISRSITNFPLITQVDDYKIMFRTREKYELIFDYLFSKTDPLTPLLMLGGKVKSFKEQIRQKFKLNVIYEFEADGLYSQGRHHLKDFDGEINEFRKKLLLLAGRKMSFRDVLAFIDRPDMTNAYFNADPGV